MDRRRTKRTIARFVTNRLVNPVVRPLLARGLFGRTHALLETTGRRSGVQRRVPVGNGLRGDIFWVVTEHGYAADYVKNIQKDPHVRVQGGADVAHGARRDPSGRRPPERMRLARPAGATTRRCVSWVRST